ncbi:MAG: glycosyltransferase [Nocardioidaceae bacterium]
MRIALVSEHANPLATVGGVDAGGQNVHVAALAGHLVRQGHEVTVFTRRDDPSLSWRVEAPEGYLVEHVPAGPPTEVPKDSLLPHMPAFADYLQTRWAQTPYDVVHAHFWMSGIAALSAGRALGLPVIQTFHALGTVKRRHQGGRDTSPASRVVVEADIGRRADHVIATCSDEVHELEAMGLDRSRVSIVPCGVDTDLFTPEPQRSARRPKLLTVGRLVERKGVADVITALPGLPRVELVVAGGPSADLLPIDPDVERLRSRARECGVDGRVRFVGRVDRAAMPALIKSCDVVVAMPWYEPFGIVPLEAMACARPVVASAVGGLTDTVVSGVSGELVPARDSNRLTEVLAGLLADRRRREAYGAAGLNRVRNAYDWATVAAATEDVYRTVVARTSAAVFGVRR